MKICQVVPRFPYKENLEGLKIGKYHIGGVERHVYEISKSLIERGHSVTVFSTKPLGKTTYHEIDNLEVIRIPYGLSVYSSSIPYSAYKYFNPEDYDIIHAHTPTPLIADIVCIKNYNKKPFVLTYHNDISKAGLAGKIVEYAYNYTFGNFLLTDSNRIITTTRSYAKKSAYLRKYSLKIRIVPNGVNPGVYSAALSPESIKVKYGISSNSKILLFVGSLEKYKGIDYLINAFKKVLQKEKDVYLIIVGSGILYSALNELANGLQISDRVIFAGYVDDSNLPLYYAACNIFILPSVSEKEGFGIVQLEAMASGKPVICTDLPGVSEVDKENFASIHVQARNVDSLTEAILRLLSDEKLAHDLGTNGIRLINTKYSWANVAKELESVYNEVV